MSTRIIVIAVGSVCGEMEGDLMASAKKLPSGSWRVQVYAGTNEAGKRQYKSFTAGTKKEAELMAAQWAASDRAEEKIGMLVGEAIDRYIEIKAGVLSPSTILGYKRQRRNCYKDIEKQPISKLTNALLQKWVSDFAADNSPKYTSNAWGLLISAVKMFRDGFEPKITLPQKEKGKIEIPQPDEMRAFYEAVKGTALEVPFLLASQCGLRASEIAGLRRVDVDADAQEITISQARVMGEDGATIKAPKTMAGYRTIACAAEICRLAADGEGEFVTNLDSNGISSSWSKMVRRKGLPCYGFHALRHYFASNAALIGIPKEYLIELMGHSSSRMLDQVYMHTFRAAKIQFSQKLAGETVRFLSDAQHEKQHDN